MIGNSVKFTPANGQVKVRARFVPDVVPSELIESDQNSEENNEVENVKKIDSIPYFPNN